MRETETETDRQTDRQTETDGERDRQTDRQTERTVQNVMLFSSCNMLARMYHYEKCWVFTGTSVRITSTRVGSTVNRRHSFVVVV